MRLLETFRAGRVFLLPLAAVMALGACSWIHQNTTPQYPDTQDRDEKTNDNDIYSKPQTIFDAPGKNTGGGLHLFGGDKDNAAPGIDVNAFLWRASLDTVSFMPLASADPFGGTILTDWFSPPQSPDERYKLNVLILGRQLRSDGVQVKVFRQVRSTHGGWQDAAVPADMGPKVEDAILTRARQLRVAQAGGQ